MADQLRADIDGLGVLCAQAADWYATQGLRISANVIEKDFWVTEALRVVAKGHKQAAPSHNTYPVNVRAVFKGGTSLSKAYGLIDRFSEDIDVYLDISRQPGSATPGAQQAGKNYNAPDFTVGNSRVDTLMKQVAAGVATELGINQESWGTSRTGTKRGFRLLYPRPEAAAPLAGQMKEGVILELVRMGTPDPNASHELRSMLSHWAAMTGELALGDYEELQPFSIDVLAAERTLVDKLCILHDLGTAMSADPAKGTGYHARHYYDVHQLLSSPAVIQSLTAQQDLVSRYAKTAAAESAAARRPSDNARPDTGFADSPAFRDEVIKQAQAEYAREMGNLGFGHFPDLDAVAAVVRQHADLL